MSAIIIQKIKALVSNGAVVYAANDSYRVIKDNLGQYLINFNNGENYVGLHGMEGTTSEFRLNMSHFYTYASDGVKVPVTDDEAQQS